MSQPAPARPHPSHPAGPAPPLPAFGPRTRPRRLRLAALAAVLHGSLATAALPGTLSAQATAPAPVDTLGLASGALAAMETLYERTLFGIDVFTLRVAVDPEAARGFRRVVRERGSPEAREEALARVALEARDVLVRTRFHRGVGVERFLEGMLESLGHARAAGCLTRAEEEAVARGALEQYTPLGERGLREGDAVWYRVRGDSVHFAVQAADGTVLRETRHVGAEHRRALLASYFAPGAELRTPLLRSLLSGADPG
ncbi:MAG: hypothetical protein RQ751_10330 [Longimicrobiales bacterium]|nr:hypothetical protein [Longimicrobiales bacterium]